MLKDKREYCLDALHIFTVWGLFVAQPLLDLLSKNVSFFVARQSNPLEILLFIILLCFVLPGILALIELQVGLFWRLGRKVLHWIVFGALLGIGGLIFFKRYEIPAIWVVASALTLGIGGTLLYAKFGAVRMFFTVLIPSVLIFPCFFLLKSEVIKLVFPEKTVSVIKSDFKGTTPLIMVVFDEFPVISLMDDNRQIDKSRYPNFRRLAEDSAWFRNATTINSSTQKAIPAILTGTIPDKDLAPTAVNYPNNLFTLMGSSYRIKAIEPYTMICPEDLCSKMNSNNVRSRLWSMMLDITAVYLRTVVPEALSKGLPVVTEDWKNLWIPQQQGREVLNVDRVSMFRDFVKTVGKSEEPTAYFNHSVLPHSPWEYLPSGKRYYVRGRLPCGNLDREEYGDYKWLLDQAYQRHLLQVGCVDKLLGELILKLKKEGIYEKSLLVVTADHGANFSPGRYHLHEAAAEDPMGVIGIPLFIKAPFQEHGLISDRKVKSIDILPTIADFLGIAVPWPIVGRSLVPDFLDAGDSRGGMNAWEGASTLERKLQLFDSGNGEKGLFGIGPNHNLVGQSVDKNTVKRRPDISINIADDLSYKRINPEAEWVPAYVNGTIKSQNGIGQEPLEVAIAVNGRIEAVSWSFAKNETEARFGAVVREKAFRPGSNSVRVYIVEKNTGEKLTFVAGSDPDTATYRLSSEQIELVRNSDSSRIGIVPGRLMGHVTTKIREGKVEFYGWVADTTNMLIPDVVVCFVNGEHLVSIKPELDRPDVAKHFQNPDLRRSGFFFKVPKKRFDDFPEAEVRLFAVQETVASELHYSQDFLWNGPKKQGD